MFLKQHAPGTRTWALLDYNIFGLLKSAVLGWLWTEYGCIWCLCILLCDKRAITTMLRSWMYVGVMTDPLFEYNVCMNM
jgi:hypothetical protein